jgi:AcrR family transcriptional regulator
VPSPADDAPVPTERNREQTAARMVEAVGEVLARDGFAGIGVNAVAKQAGVDKVLLYRYFGGLPELLQAYGRNGDFWPSAQEMLGNSDNDSDRTSFDALPLSERYAVFFERFIDALRRRPLTLEILAAELVERNELTAILEERREQWGEDVAQLLGGAEIRHRPELLGITLLLISGVQYLLVRSRKIRIFGGVDIRSDEGWQVLKSSVRAMAQRLLG